MLDKLEVQLDLYFNKKAPQLPKNVKEAIVKYGPYITIVLLILMLPVLLGALGISAIVAPFAFLGSAQGGILFILGWIALLIQLGLEVAALPGLFKRQKAAWNLMFYSSLVSILYNLLTMNLVSMVVGALISFYFLFQIRSYYK